MKSYWVLKWGTLTGSIQLYFHPHGASSNIREALKFESKDSAVEHKMKDSELSMYNPILIEIDESKFERWDQR